MKRLFLSAIFFAFISLTSANAQETILAYYSDITVNEDSSLDVTEFIKVTAEGNQIKRGIYRDFPLNYTDKNGKTKRVGFEIIGVKRDNQPENYHTENIDGGKRIYIGNKDVYLQPGTYLYAINYKTTKQIRYFDSYDELYWNVTGNKWSFPIEKAYAKIKLPYDIKPTQFAGYTGPEGATEKNYTVSFDGNNIIFETIKPLNSYEGLTVAVSIPKGILPVPTQTTYEMPELIMAGVLGFLAIYYFLIWLAVGKDPQKGTIVPLFSAPKDFSPAMCSYVKSWGKSSANNAITASITNLAVKGLVKILKFQHDKSNKYTIKKLRDAAVSEISEEEEIIMKQLFNANPEYTIGSRDDSKIQSIISSYSSAIKSKMRGQYFVYNRKYSLLGLIITAIGTVLSFGKSDYDPEAIFLMMWLSIWSIGCFFMLAIALVGWKEIITKGKGKGLAIFMTFFMLPFWTAEIFVIKEIIKLTSFNFSILLAASFGIHALFFRLLPKPTPHAQKILDELEGLELYLTVAEKERYKQFYEADITPETYEKLLPYAIALGVEEKWSERFSSSINASTYQPSWYEGGSSNSFSRGGFSGTAFAGGFAAGFGSALASANTSSSGSGGGGSSGGGGGGGGGGGW